MKKSERLLEAVGMIDEKHLPDPESILKKQADNNIQEYYAEMTISDGKKKKSPFKWAAFGTAACAAAVAGAIFLRYIPAIDSSEGASNASDPVFPKAQWDTATGMETNLETNYDLDYSNYFAHNASEAGNQNNPWNESLELETLPVFLNMNYGKQNDDGYVLLLTEEEMTQTAERAADKLGLNIEDTNVVYAVSNDMPIELTAVCSGEKYGVEQIKILVYGSGGTVDIRFGEKEGGANYNNEEEQCYQLPEGYKLPCSVTPGLGTTDSQEEDEKAINLMYEQFKALTGYDNPEIAVSNMPHYSNSTLTEYKLWDKDEDIVRNILNYNLTGVKFISKGCDQKQLWDIELSNSLCTSHYAGDYPTITVQEAKEKLLDKLAIVPPGYAVPVITEDRIEKTELIYGNTKTEKYIMPYYRFYVRSENEAEGMEGYYQYSQYYVPAIWDMYLEDMSDKRIYNEVSSYWYNTENLPQITSRFTFRGSGADGFNALYLRSEEQIANSDIWQRGFELTEAAVFRNLAFNADQPYEPCYLDAEEMERMARAAVHALGGNASFSEIQSIYSDNGVIEQLTALVDIPHLEPTAVLTVKPCGDLSIVFGIDENGAPVGLNYDFDISDEAGLRETAESLKNWYSELIQYVEADTDLVYNTDNDRYELYIHQHSEDVVRNMINRYLNNVYFGLRETEEGGVLTEITFYNRLCAAEYLGYYPLVSYDEAVELLLNGDYRSYVKKSKLKGGVISEADILHGELVYNNGAEDEYFQPYYKFYVELNETADLFNHSDDEKVYGVFWVPAVVEEYRDTEKFLGADEGFLEEIYGKERDFFPLDLLNYYIDSDGFYRVDQDALKPTEDYELFRKYFFGAWEGSFSLPSSFERDGLIIDDSLKSYIMTETDIRLAGFYEVNGHVLAFVNGSSGGSSIHWLDTDNPNTMYIAWGGVGEHNPFWSTNEDGSPAARPTVYSLTKTDDPPNQPEENFLSIYKLHEMSRDYGIDFDMLVSIEYENEDGTERLWHDDWAQFYPVYLVSETTDKLVLKTTVGNVYSPDEEAEAVYIIEKIGGEWVRTVEIDDKAGVR